MICKMLLHLLMRWAYVLSLLFVSAFSRIEISLEHAVTNKYIVSSSSLRDIPSSTLYLCIRECHSRQQCRFISFFKITRICRLAWENVQYKTNDEVYTFDVRNGMSSEIISGPCANTSCPVQYQCIVLSTNQPVCLMRECKNLEENPIDGFIRPYNKKIDMVALGKINKAENVSCPFGYAGPERSVTVLCKTGGWTQLEKKKCYECDNICYVSARLERCFKQMNVTQTYAAAKEQCKSGFKMPQFNRLSHMTVFVSLSSECTWIDSVYDVENGKWLNENGKNFKVFSTGHTYRNQQSYSNTMRQVLCPDGVFEYRDENLTAGTICQRLIN